MEESNGETLGKRDRERVSSSVTRYKMEDLEEEEDSVRTATEEPAADLHARLRYGSSSYLNVWFDMKTSTNTHKDFNSVSWMSSCVFTPYGHDPVQITFASSDGNLLVPRDAMQGMSRAAAENFLKDLDELLEGMHVCMCSVLRIWG